MMMTSTLRMGCKTVVMEVIYRAWNLITRRRLSLGTVRRMYAEFLMLNLLSNIPKWTLEQYTTWIGVVEVSKVVIFSYCAR